jgi:hypothetical protein
VKIISTIKSSILIALSIFLGVFLVSCTLSAPPATEKTQPSFVLKLVPYSKDQNLISYFTLADSHTNQVAANGLLRVQVYTTTSLSFSSGEGTAYQGLNMRNILYDGNFNVGVSNFHWESFGSLLKVNDLACRFVVPYDRFTKPFAKGQMATVEITFRPDGANKQIRSASKVSLY